MPTFTFDSIDKALMHVNNSIVKAANSTVGEESSKILESKIKETVYARPESWYDRTNSFLDSVDFRVDEAKGDITLFVFNAPKLMSPQHTSVMNGSVVDSYLGGWLDSGHKGIWDYSAQNFYSLAEAEIQSKLPTILMNALKKYGIDIV